jgi:hypothetical protein
MFAQPLGCRPNTLASSVWFKAVCNGGSKACAVRLGDTDR